MLWNIVRFDSLTRQDAEALPEQAQTAPAAEPEATEATKPLRRWGRQRVRLHCISGIGTAKHIGKRNVMECAK